MAHAGWVTASDGSADRAGQVLGGYRIERLLAVGASASVWAARHEARGIDAVAKVHEADLACGRDPSSRDRFLREAVALSEIRHHNVVALYEVGETELGEPYLITERLEGEGLDERLLRDPMAIDEILEVAIGLLAGLEAVHRTGLLHRDVKPENVFLAREGGERVVKLLDFGLARGLTASRGKKLTRAGAAVGTPGYMSPEQARGRTDLDVRSDVYSVGVVLYEMLAGRVPFCGCSAADVMIRACTEEPEPIASLRPDVDPALAAIVASAISRERDSRFDDARAMRGALLAFRARTELT